MINLEFFIAYRFLKYKIWRSFLVILGIALGVSIQLFVSIIIDSTQNNLIKRTLGYSPHITIKPYENDKINDKVKNPEKIINEIIGDDDKFKKIILNVESGVIFYDFNQIFSASGKIISFKELKGEDIYGIKENLIKGFFSLENNNVILGNKIVESLNADLNDYVIIKNQLNNKYLGAKIVGIFKTGNQQLDNYALINLNRAQDLLGYKRNEYSSIIFQVYDIFNSDKIKKDLLNNYVSKYEISEWKESNKQLLNALSAQRSSGLFIQSFILISIIISLFSIINMKIFEKYKEIGVLKALGMSNLSLMKVFINISLILGFIGVVLGLIISLIMIKLFINLTKSPEGSFIFNIVIRFPYLFITLFIDVLATIFAGYLSSKKISKIQPAQIIIGG
jgi:lipoprotein-releasing system permease protein